MKRQRQLTLTQVNRSLQQLATQLAKDSGIKISIEIEPLTPHSNGKTPARGTRQCAWPGCRRQVTGQRCRTHAQLYRAQEDQLKPGRLRQIHQRAAMRSGSYNLCECGRSKPTTEKECDVCRELNKHRQAPGR